MTKKAALLDENLLELHFSKLNYKLKNVLYADRMSILNDASGKFRSGHLSAIIGPDGAGKSALLSVLAGFKFAERYYWARWSRQVGAAECFSWFSVLRAAQGEQVQASGQILFNGQPRDLCAFRKISAFVDKTAIMAYLLTVQETFQFYAALKLAKFVTKKEQQNLLNDIIKKLNLDRCRHRLVRDISGHEHKRLAIGIELIGNPQVIFIDEPTSGMDNSSSIYVMGYLQRLAREGRIVVCVLSQPSSPIMQFFDDILMIHKGEVLYSGAQHDMLENFKLADSTPYENVLDILEQWSGLEGESWQEISELLSTQNKQRHDSPSSPTDDEQSSQLDLFGMTDARLSQDQVAIWLQLFVLLQRQLLCSSRNLHFAPKRILLHIAVPLGHLFIYMLEDVSFQLSCCLLYLGSCCLIRCGVFVVKDFPLVNREYCNGYYSRSVYITVKCIADLPLQLFWLTLFIIMGISMCDPYSKLYHSKVFQFWILTGFAALAWIALGRILMRSFLNILLLPPTVSTIMSAFSFFMKHSYLFNPLNLIYFFQRPVQNLKKFDKLLSEELLHMNRFGHVFRVFQKTYDDFNWEVFTIHVTLFLNILFIYSFQFLYFVSTSSYVLQLVDLFQPGEANMLRLIGNVRFIVLLPITPKLDLQQCCSA